VSLVSGGNELEEKQLVGRSVYSRIMKRLHDGNSTASNGGGLLYNQSHVRPSPTSFNGNSHSYRQISKLGAACWCIVLPIDMDTHVSTGNFVGV
jgi:hypothetical protein